MFGQHEVREPVSSVPASQELNLCGPRSQHALQGGWLAANFYFFFSLTHSLTAKHLFHFLQIFKSFFSLI